MLFNSYAIWYLTILEVSIVSSKYFNMFWNDENLKISNIFIGNLMKI